MQAMASGEAHRGRGRFWSMITLLTGALVVGAFWAGTHVKTPEALAQQQRPARPTLLTAPVSYKRLFQQLALTGTIEPSGTFQVSFGQVSVPDAQPEVTAPPPRAGTVIVSGSVLAQIAGEPVFALPGATPMYRDLASGDSGSDVYQLQEDLAALGFPSYDSPGVYGSSTQAAVRAFFEHSGYVLPQSSPSTSPSSSPSGKVGKGGTPAPVVVPQASIVFVPKLPAVVESSQLVVGQTVTNPAMVLGTGNLRAILPLTQGQQALIRRGDRVTLTVFDSGLAVAHTAATVAAVTSIVLPTASSSTASGGNAGQAEEVAEIPARQLRRYFVGDKVSASVTIAATAGPVLAVPIAALYSLPDGATAVTVISHGKRTTVPVSAGPSIGGYVPITPVKSGQLTVGANVLLGE
jgi:peptidoglycan hydrolase-like protein with peptidoglycan-binding domain